jgi:Tol biopolymer transport system component
MFPRAASGPLLSEQRTFSSERKEGPIVTDGTRLYFQSEGQPVEMSVNGGLIAALRASVSGMRLLDVSPDGSEMLALKPDPIDQTRRGSLWSVPVLGGSPRTLGNQLARSAHWSPDGRLIVYAEVNSVYVSRGDGADIRKIWDAPGETDLPYFSPDSRRISVTVSERGNPSRLWELNVDGSSAHRIDLDWPEDAVDVCRPLDAGRETFRLRIDSRKQRPKRRLRTHPAALVRVLEKAICSAIDGRIH